MKGKYFALLALLGWAFAPASQAADYVIDQSHSHVGFSVRHIATKVKGEFKDFEGTFSFDEAKPSASKVKVTIQAASIHTNNEKRDAHLRNADFFDVEKHPALTFTSKKVTAAGKGKYKVEGDLTLRGVTKTVVLDVEHLGGDTAWGSKVAGFSASARINRQDFGVSFSKTLESGKLLVGDEVDITLEIEAKEKK